VRSPTATNPFQLDTRPGKGGQSDESDEEQASQKHVQARPASSGSGDAPLSPNTLVESDIDPYPDDAVPIGLLASLAISSRDTPGVATDKTHKGNATADDDDVVRLYSFLRTSSSARERRTDETFVLLIGCRQQDVLYARPVDEPWFAQVFDRQDEATGYFGA
jgi:hypothetical protein